MNDRVIVRLGIQKEFKHGNSTIYLTYQVSPKKLNEYFDWLKENLGEPEDKWYYEASPESVAFRYSEDALMFRLKFSIYDLT